VVPREDKVSRYAWNFRPTLPNISVGIYVEEAPQREQFHADIVLDKTLLLVMAAVVNSAHYYNCIYVAMSFAHYRIY